MYVMYVMYVLYVTTIHKNILTDLNYQKLHFFEGVLNFKILKYFKLLNKNISSAFPGYSFDDIFMVRNYQLKIKNK